jgi:DNA-binding MarR family transcriptional regulator/N-acetylglutamate synthase-like GNAT family acetyltransferase
VKGDHQLLDYVNYVDKILCVPRRTMVQDDLETEVEAVRRFNRFFTQRIGVLDESLLASQFTLTQARVLFEIARCKSCTAGELTSILGLDPGYLSRILEQFVGSGLVRRKRSAEDGRRQNLALSPKGRKSFATLDRRSRRSIGELIGPLSSTQRVRLVQSLGSVQTILSAGRAKESRNVAVRPYRIGDVGWAIERHAQLYAAEFGWNEEFEALVATLFAKFATTRDSATEQFWIAEVDEERAGCVFIVRSEKDPSAAQLRCLLVEPNARGLGIGRTLVDECIRFSKSAGYRRMILWTNDILISARRIYEAAGFSLVEQSPHHSFGHALVGQFWTLDL